MTYDFKKFENVKNLNYIINALKFVSWKKAIKTLNFLALSLNNKEDLNKYFF